MEPEKKPEPVKTPAPPKVPQAVEELNVVDIHGKTSFTGRAQKAEGQAEWKDKSERINRVNLFVKNLGDNIDNERLRKEFSQFGTITSAKVETKDGRSKGFGYVCFSSPEEATKAITEMDGRIVDGKSLYVALHQRKEDRKAHLASQYMEGTASIRMQVDGLAIKEEEQEGAARSALLDDNASSFKQARAKQEDERMTEATTSRHESNYIKIAMVVLNVSPRAVRVQFDKKFLPIRLQSILKEYVFHLNDLKRKKRITQSQWNLLFPKTGEQPLSKDFDITLMICLLRNLIPIDIMDNRLPAATDTSLGADLSRIKYYRNIIAHFDSTLLDETDFESYWNDITPAILRLGGNSLKVECDDWYGKHLYAKQRDDGLQSTKVEKRLALVEESLEKIKKWIESDQEKSNPVPNNIRVPIIELKGHTFKVDDGKSVAIECNGFIFDEKRPPFWEWIHEDGETKKLTIREDKKDKYLLNSDPPYLWIFNAEMSDRGYYRCCIEYSTSNGDEIVRSKKAHLIVEKAVKPGDMHTHIDKQVNIKANNINADTINMGGDETNITMKNTDKKEQTDTSEGSSSSSSSENEMPENFDKMEKGRHNSDCGQEPGDGDIIKETMSKMKPVSVTEQNNISNIEKIAAKHGFSVKNVRVDGNCMFHAIALQLLDNKLKSKIGEEKSKELRCKIVEFLKNNGTTPTGEKYSSFLSSVHENERESRWSTYLASMSKPGTYGDEIILRAVSHCFNVHIHVLSTASPERFIKYNSPDISEDSSTVYLGFIDEYLHYVRLQPESSGNQRPYTSMNESSV